MVVKASVSKQRGWLAKFEEIVVSWILERGRPSLITTISWQLAFRSVAEFDIHSVDSVRTDRMELEVSNFAASGCIQALCNI